MTTLEFLPTRDLKIVLEGLTPAQAESVARYGEFLIERELPVIYSGSHFSKIIGVDSHYLFAITNKPSNFYRVFNIPKKNGGRRTIKEPLPLLKLIQRWILNNIVENIERSPYVKSYIKGMNLKHNARFHMRQDFVFKIDLERFFDHISLRHVYEIFYTAGYTREVSTLLAKLCLADGTLCQGAPTSGALSNIVLLDFDHKLFDYCRSNGFRYTRYSDDITVSGEINTTVNFKELLIYVSELALNYGFKINKGKSRVFKRNTRQEVTGIVVNERLSAPKPLRRRFRQEVYYVERYGPRGHADRNGEALDECLARLIGMASHLLFVRPDDEFVRAKKELLVRTMRGSSTKPPADWAFNEILF